MNPNEIIAPAALAAASLSHLDAIEAGRAAGLPSSFTEHVLHIHGARAVFLCVQLSVRWPAVYLAEALHGRGLRGLEDLLPTLHSPSPLSPNSSSESANERHDFAEPARHDRAADATGTVAGRPEPESSGPDPEPGAAGT